MHKAAFKVCQARPFPGALAMPKNSIKTSNCQYASNGKTCGRPPHFLHIKSGKVFCWNHYSKLSVVTSGWVNLQRSDAAQEIARIKSEESALTLNSEGQVS